MKTITVSDETHELLASRGKKGDSFDVIISKLLEESQ